MSTFKVDHDKPTCIGCGACAALHPDNWVMGSDGKAEVLNPDLGTKKDLDLEAAESCPVNCIHIIEVTDAGEEKKLI